MLDGILFEGDGFFVHVSVLRELYITQLYTEIKEAVKKRLRLRQTKLDLRI